MRNRSEGNDKLYVASMPRNPYTGGDRLRYSSIGCLQHHRLIANTADPSSIHSNWVAGKICEEVKMADVMLAIQFQPPSANCPVKQWLLAADAEFVERGVFIKKTGSFIAYAVGVVGR